MHDEADLRAGLALCGNRFSGPNQRNGYRHQDRIPQVRSRCKNLLEELLRVIARQEESG
ncbi:MAG TPA: hypothetical protein VMV65_02155 [Alphaproteobacteria bacterium]|nr:hypothetical protein [Alphaproteobacteria bacterium]